MLCSIAPALARADDVVRFPAGGRQPNGLLGRNLIELKWQPIGVGEEDETPVCVLVDAHILNRDTFRFKKRFAGVDVVNAKGKVTQTACFRV